MSIAVVILNWNGKSLLQQFLPSVLKYSKEATVYVVDNGSTDDSISYLEENAPEVKIIKNKVNGGYAQGYNDGLKGVSEDIYCLLNSDVEVTQNWLSPILKHFKNNANTAIIQPKILDQKNKNTFEYAGAAGGFIDKYGYPYCRGRIFNTIETDKGQYDTEADIFWASGACLFIRKDVFKTLNGFDTSFFAHMEEIDLCWRAQHANFKVKYLPNSVVYHVGGATLDASHPKKTYLNFRNSLYTLTKNASGNLFWLLIKRLLLDGIAGLKFLIELKPAHTFAIIKAHFAFYYNLSKQLEQRDQPSKLKKYYHKTSIVWLYFVNKKKTFDRL